MADGSRTAIVVALIGVAGTLGAALISKCSNPPGSSGSSGRSASLADIAVVDVVLSPSPPVQGQPIVAKVTIANHGGLGTGPFDVQWWPGENFPSPITISVQALAPAEQKTVSFSYPGYASWYARLTTKVVVDPAQAVSESARDNNVWRKEIAVRRP